MLTLGRSGDGMLAARFARALAAEMRAVGISLDFTPVLDIRTNPENDVIGDRAFGDKPEDVARLGRVVIETLQACGIAACGKHFPGHGDTSADSHVELPLVEHPPDRLDAVEYVPFKAAIAAGVAGIMTAHILVPALDEELPATLSPAIVDAVLKKGLGFEGVVFSDDLDMKAIAARYSTAEAAVRAIGAGCDVVLMCGASQEPQFAALEALVHAVEDQALPLERVEDALARHRRVKGRFLAAPSSGPLETRALRTVLGRDEHQAIAAEMARFA
jgi:beta-N-acetylhexosaminidase